MKATSTLLKGLVVLCLFFTTNIANILHAEEDMFAIYCPADVTVSCQEELWDLSGYGNAYYHDYNGQHDAGAPYVSYNLSSCNVGTITRTWSVEDYNWNIHSCSQTITVVPTGGFNSYNIHWPEPYIELEGCNPAYGPGDLPYGYGYPTYDYAECSLIGLAYEDQVFHLGPTCTKILRTYKVIDWCTYNGSGGPYSNGLYTFVQTIKISKSDIPTIDYAPEIVFQSYNCQNKNVVAPPLYVPPSVCGGDFTITNDSPFADNNGADLSGTYPIGTTNVTFTVRYGCNGKIYHNVDIVVVDAKGPTPYCLGEITTTLMPIDNDNDGIPDEGMVEIWAKDLDFGSTGACNNGPVQFSFSEDVTDKFKVFDCSNVGDNYLRIYVTDSQGNFNWCKVNVIIQNNSANIPDCDGDAPDMYNVAGRVAMANAENVSDAQIQIRSMEPIITNHVGYYTVEVLVTDSTLNAQGYWEPRSRYEERTFFGNYTTTTFGEAEITTDNNGNYILDQTIMEDVEYMITGNYTADNGSVNYADVKALLYHIQGYEEFTTAYQYLAADIDQNGTIDYNDLGRLLQYVNGKTDELVTDKKWVLVDGDHTYTNPADIINGSCPEAIYIMSHGTDITNRNFVAIRYGDLTDASIVISPNVELAENLQHAIDNNMASEIETIARSLENITANVSVSPNPFTEDFVISYSANTDEDITITLRDVSGKLISTQVYNAHKGGNTYRINVDEQVSGLVICTLTSESINQTLRLIKE